MAMPAASKPNRLAVAAIALRPRIVTNKMSANIPTMLARMPPREPVRTSAKAKINEPTSHQPAGPAVAATNETARRSADRPTRFALRT